MEHLKDFRQRRGSSLPQSIVIMRTKLYLSSVCKYLEIGRQKQRFYLESSVRHREVHLMFRVESIRTSENFLNPASVRNSSFGLRFQR